MPSLNVNILFLTPLLFYVGCSNQYSDINLVCKGSSDSVSIFEGNRTEYAEPNQVVSYKFSYVTHPIENFNSITNSIEKSNKKIWTVLVNGKDLIAEKNTLQKSPPFVGEVSTVEVTEALLKGSTESTIDNNYFQSQRLLSFEIDRLSGKWNAKSETHLFHKRNGEKIQSSLSGVIASFSGTCESIKTNKL